MKTLAFLILAAASFAVPAHAQFWRGSSTEFDPQGLERLSFPSHSCTGFWRTPTFRCATITVPAYLARAKDGSRRALVILSGNAGGMDRRHGDYARHLADNNINAIVIDSFKARGHQGGVGANLNKYRDQGLNGFNMGIDALTAVSHFGRMPDWQNAKIGYLGESMGGAASINVTRPYIAAIVTQNGLQVRDYDAVVALYPPCFERNVIERFKPIPFLLIQPEKDDVTLARQCKLQAEWMNGRGGSVTYVELAGEYHDYDAPWPLKRLESDNPSECSFLNNGSTYVLEDGREFPATEDGYRHLHQVCMKKGYMTGNRGNSRTGYEIWTGFFIERLLKN